MIVKKKILLLPFSAFALALMMSSNLAHAQSRRDSNAAAMQSSADQAGSKYQASAAKQVDDAVAVVHRMEAEPRLKDLMQQAKGVFIVPHYGRAAIGIGGSGGSGVLLAKRSDGTWSDPAFYNLGGVNIGLQAGAEAGPIAMVLNNDKAVDRFMQKNNFSLSADSGITVVNWTKVAQGTVGKGDAVAWGGTRGLFGNVVTVGLNDIRFNHTLNDAYYGQGLAANDIVQGNVRNAQADTLKQALASISSGSTSSGANGQGMSGSGMGRNGMRNGGMHDNGMRGMRGMNAPGGQQ